MSNYADKPLRRVTINLYEEDVVYFENRYGKGWSSILRSVHHAHIIRAKLNDIIQEDKLNGK